MFPKNQRKEELQMKLVVRKREGSTNEEDEHIVYLADRPDTWEVGKTRSAALGQMLITLASELGIKIVAWENEPFFRTLMVDRRRKDLGKIREMLRETKVTREDVGKAFVIEPDESSGMIVTMEELSKMDIDAIGAWTHISEFEVNAE